MIVHEVLLYQSRTLLTNLIGSYMSWEAQLAYTLGGISSQFPSNFGLFVINPKQGCRGLKYDKSIYKKPWDLSRLTIAYSFKFETIL